MSLIVDKDNEYGVRIIGDGGEDPAKGVLNVTSASAAIASLLVGKTIVGNASQAALRIAHPSTASGAVMGFSGGFVSCTSLVLTSVANIDYVIPVELNGEARYIPVFKAAAIYGAAVPA